LKGHVLTSFHCVVLIAVFRIPPVKDTNIVSIFISLGFNKM